jgi:Na+/alanine symporter
MKALRKYFPSFTHKTFEMQLKCLNFAVLWKSPSKGWRYFSISNAILTFLTTTFVLVHELAFIYQNITDVYAVCECIVPFIAQFSASLKFFILWHKCDKVHELIEDIKEFNEKCELYEN